MTGALSQKHNILDDFVQHNRIWYLSELPCCRLWFCFQEAFPWKTWDFRLERTQDLLPQCSHWVSWRARCSSWRPRFLRLPFSPKLSSPSIEPAQKIPSCRLDLLKNCPSKCLPHQSLVFSKDIGAWREKPTDPCTTVDKQSSYRFSQTVVTGGAQLGLDVEVSQLNVVLDWWDPSVLPRFWVVGQGDLDLGGGEEEEQQRLHLGR